MDYTKEDYVQPDANLNSEFWRNNITMVLLEQYKNLMNGNVADYGCNHGLWAARVSLLDAVNRVDGFDLNRKSLAHGYDKVFPQIPATSHKVALHEMNLVDLNWTTCVFDFVYSFHTLEHIFEKDIPQVMKNMSAPLKQGGHFLVNLPEKNSYLWEPLHIYHITLEELDTLFDTHGFDKVESYEDQRGGQTGHSKNITGLYQKR